MTQGFTLKFIERTTHMIPTENLTLPVPAETTDLVAIEEKPKKKKDKKQKPSSGEFKPVKASLNPTFLSLSQIVSNTENARAQGPIPALWQMGYGVFQRQKYSDKPALLELALSEDHEQRAHFCELVEKYASADHLVEEVEDKEGEKKKISGGIPGLARSLIAVGWIHPARVRIEKDGYDLIVGSRRALATAYNYAKTGVEALVWAIVDDMNDKNAGYMSFAENEFRTNDKGAAVVDQGRYFKKLENMGLNPQQISERTGVDHQTVRGRLSLIKNLKEEEVDDIAAGRMPYTKALKIVKARRDARKGKTTPEPVVKGRGATGKNDRRTSLTLKASQELYDTRADLDKMTVREFLAGEVLLCKYVPFKEWSKKLEEAKESNGNGKK
jgi:ParB-like chromosome segregation protein Spo0J